jgi:flagellar biosynthesis/type III secretory pathway protein FliH
MRTFRLIGDELTFDGQTVATMNPRLAATLRDELDQFLDGLTLDAIPEDELQEIIERERADAHAEGLSEGYDKGYRDGHENGRRAT